MQKPKTKRHVAGVDLIIYSVSGVCLLVISILVWQDDRWMFFEVPSSIMAKETWRAVQSAIYGVFGIWLLFSVVLNWLTSIRTDTHNSPRNTAPPK
jgi:heme/copper-type cytochrome/quinol oxidase subunit 2